MATKTFKANALASVIKNRLFSPFDEYRDLLNHLVGRELALWEVSQARWACSQRLLKDFPELKALPDVPEKIDASSVNKYMRGAVKAIASDEFEVKGGSVKFAPLLLSHALMAKRAN